MWIGNGLQNLAGGLALIPFAFAMESVRDVVPSWRLVAGLAYCALLVSIIGYLLWFHLLDNFGATAASAYHFIMPPLGMLFGWLLIGEQVAFADLIGIVPVALGIYLVTRPAAPAPGMVVERMLDGHGSCDRWDTGATSVVSSKWRDRCDR